MHCPIGRVTCLDLWIDCNLPRDQKGFLTGPQSGNRLLTLLALQELCKTSPVQADRQPIGP
ncbi:hypothetical protein OMCYN_01875 [cyanobiont of Ornithocercus magnificus]|nr:hypothetical protein OMCYN_01875 [cyanobiont of Ornithocercus magnificus]